MCCYGRVIWSMFTHACMLLGQLDNNVVWVGLSTVPELRHSCDVSRKHWCWLPISIIEISSLCLQESIRTITKLGYCNHRDVVITAYLASETHCFKDHTKNPGSARAGGVLPRGTDVLYSWLQQTLPRKKQSAHIINHCSNLHRDVVWVCSKWCPAASYGKSMYFILNDICVILISLPALLGTQGT